MGWEREKETLIGCFMQIPGWDWESNPCAFIYGTNLLPAEPHQPGHNKYFNENKNIINPHVPIGQFQ